MTGRRWRIVACGGLGVAFGGLVVMLDGRLQGPVLMVPFVVAGAVDVRTRRIPNALSAFILGGMLAASAGTGGLTAAASGALVALVAGIGIAAVGRGAFGMGDVKLMAGAGALVGLGRVLPFLFAMTLAGGVLALGYFALRRGPRATMPYAPAIAGGLAWVVCFVR